MEFYKIAIFVAKFSKMMTLVELKWTVVGFSAFDGKPVVPFPHMFRLSPLIWGSSPKTSLLYDQRIF